MSMKHRLNVWDICLFASCGKNGSNLQLFLIQRLKTLYCKIVHPHVSLTCFAIKKKKTDKWFGLL